MRCSRLSFFASQRGGSLLLWGSLASNSFLNCTIGKAGNQRPHAPQPRNMHDNESYRRERDFSVKPPPPLKVDSQDISGYSRLDLYQHKNMD